MLALAAARTDRVAPLSSVLVPVLAVLVLVQVLVVSVPVASVLAVWAVDAVDRALDSVARDPDPARDRAITRRSRSR